MWRPATVPERDRGSILLWGLAELVVGGLLIWSDGATGEELFGWRGITGMILAAMGFYGTFCGATGEWAGYRRL
jgi:hypothetical protein